MKGPLYAEAGIREYWIVDLQGEAIEVYRRPRGGRYEDVARVERGASLTAEAFPQLALTVDQILG